jgi:hypothetical protein
MKQKYSELQAAAEHGRIIIATMKTDAFERYFAPQINKSVFVISTFVDALACWQQPSETARTIVFTDYATLGDGQTGFRLAKAIRDAEKVNFTALPCEIYLMADNPKSLDSTHAHRIGASGVLPKTPEAALSIIEGREPTPSGVVDRRTRKLEPGALRIAVNTEMRGQIELLNSVLRRFIGAASTQVSTDAFHQISVGKLPPTSQAYTEYLASRIPSEEMRRGFLSVAKTKK